MSHKVLWGVHRPSDDSHFACHDESDALQIAKEINDCAEQCGLLRTAYASSMIYVDDPETHTKEIEDRMSDEVGYFM